jgi:hypothetical protein
LECLETTTNSKQETSTTKYKWVTNFDLNPKRVIPLANNGGRLRWKIENEAPAIRGKRTEDLNWNTLTARMKTLAKFSISCCKSLIASFNSSKKEASLKRHSLKA